MEWRDLGWTRPGNHNVNRLGPDHGVVRCRRGSKSAVDAAVDAAVAPAIARTVAPASDSAQLSSFASACTSTA
jgi:hypothetical protein